MRIIDRFEDGFAVIEITDEFVSVPKDELPRGAKEGDVLVCVDGVWTVDEEATKQRKNAIQSRFDRLKRKKPENE